MHLYDAVTTLKGVGPARAAQLQQLGITTLYDLLTHFPRAYEDRTRFLPIESLTPDTPACFRAMVISNPHTGHIRKGLDITKVTVADETARLNLTFFNQSYVANQLQYGQSYCFYGAVSGDFIGYQMLNPSFEPESGVVTGRIVPQYPLTAGLSSKQLGALIAQAVSHVLPELPDILPQAVQQEYGLLDAQTAYRTIHAPASFEELEQAQRRLIFEEFFLFSAGLAILRAGRTARDGLPMPDTELSAFDAALPFRLTGAQRRAIAEITADLSGAHPMNRLVQGDVGSGKTMVAAAAAYLAVKNGYQAALMAPTEILAEQHAASLRPLFAKLGIPVLLLTAGQKAAERREVQAALSAGAPCLVIGTHALLSDSTQFANLGLVIVDEQHRFGVGQRAALAEKGRAPHLLVMSATPIPRTLALLLYGDLDVSILDELPPGRQPVETFLVDERYRARVNAFIRKHVAAGHQVFVVCPAVEESETESLKSATLWAETLQMTVFPDLRVLLLHGQLKSAEKDAIMARFAAGEADILVATTVIEVGVDVPNATLIVIENAERFGLSQLHQLRGRVGRGDAQSYCVLFSENQNAQTLERLRGFCKTTDGFQIAEQDLAMRGPGDFFGSRQSGLPQFRVGDLQMNLETLKQAQEAAKAYFAGNPDPFPPLQERLQLLFRESPEAFN